MFATAIHVLTFRHLSLSTNAIDRISGLQGLSMHSDSVGIARAHHGSKTQNSLIGPQRHQRVQEWVGSSRRDSGTAVDFV